VVVANDTRGRYASEGTWHGLADDPQDGHDIVEWIATQGWSNGKVGTFGTSYPDWCADDSSRGYCTGTATAWRMLLSASS
jgi:putative CocE/NonD family hydrolase